jgi:hypothetical protein
MLFLPQLLLLRPMFGRHILSLSISGRIGLQYIIMMKVSVQSDHLNWYAVRYFRLVVSSAATLGLAQSVRESLLLFH